jgi:hypothetical protein
MKALLLSLIAVFCSLTMVVAANTNGITHTTTNNQTRITLSQHSPIPGLKLYIAQKAFEKMTKKVNDLNKKRKCKRGPGAMYFVWLGLIALVALAGIAAFVYVFGNMKV